MNEALDKIKVRIAKLLRMAQDSSSPEEAGIAAGRARALMDKHQLDAMDIGEQKEEFLAMAATACLKAIPTYMSTLAVAVAQYNDCQARYENGVHAIRTHENGKYVTFLGYTSDVQLAVEMYKRLLGNINKLCKAYLKELGYDEYDAALGGQFKIGAASAIISTLKSLTAERDALVAKAGTSLVTVKKSGVEGHFGVTKYANVKSRALTHGEQQAKARGWVEGSKVQVSTAVR